MKMGIIGRVLILGLLSGSVFAQDYDDVYIDDVNDVLNNEQIDIDGAYTRKPKKSAADRLADKRRKLEQRNEQMVQKRIEDMRIEQEKRLGGKLKGAFEGNYEEDQVSSKAAATQKAEPAAPAPAPVVIIQKQEAPKAPKAEVKKTKIIPSIGGSTIQGDRVDWDSNLDLGVSVETLLGTNLSVGVALNYSSMDISEFDSSYYGNCSNYSAYGCSPQYNGWYNQNFNDGRQVKYKQVGLELNTKLFFSTRSNLKPYIGGGVGINRASIKYDDDTQDQVYTYNQYNLGQEVHSFLFTSGRVAIGTEFSFTKDVGLDVNAFYSKTLSSTGEKSEAYQANYNPDLNRLENLGEQIKDADVLGLKAGFVVAF